MWHFCYKHAIIWNRSDLAVNATCWTYYAMWIDRKLPNWSNLIFQRMNHSIHTTNCTTHYRWWCRICKWWASSRYFKRLFINSFHFWNFCHYVIVPQFFRFVAETKVTLPLLAQSRRLQTLKRVANICDLLFEMQTSWRLKQNTFTVEPSFDSTNINANDRPRTGSGAQMDCARTCHAYATVTRRTRQRHTVGNIDGIACIGRCDKSDLVPVTSHGVRGSHEHQPRYCAALACV